MNFVNALLIALAILSVFTAIALTFWDQIVSWVDRTLFPWIKKNFPELERYARDAFATVDKVVKKIPDPIRALAKFTEIKQAWEKLRQILLKVLVEFEQSTQNEWIKRITSWATRELESKEVVVRRVSEETIETSSLPPDVRDAWLRRNQPTRIDVTDLHDRELEEYERELSMTTSN